MQRWEMTTPHIASRVSILTRPGGRVQLNADKFAPKFHGVSILTRPGGRVQLDLRVDPDDAVSVSILTRPGGRVQRTNPPS